MTHKKRITIPRETAAQVLFDADRTCSVCRIQAKPVQIHHIDDNPANNAVVNLVVLCFDCHRETMIRGGFDRKLDSEQIVLYRDDWNRIVAQTRSRENAMRDAEQARDREDMALAMSLAEVYRDAKAYVELAIHYDIFGNKELRDKYIELALAEKEERNDGTVIFLRGLQDRPDLLPQNLIERHLGKLADERSWNNRARVLKTLGRNIEAVADYLRSIRDSLENGRYFSAAFYIKELGQSGLVSDLFVEALREARKSNSLWWQVRALQELGLKNELDELLLKNSATIENMTIDDDQTADSLKELLALVRGDLEAAAQHRMEKAERSAAYAKKQKTKRLE